MNRNKVVSNRPMITWALVADNEKAQIYQHEMADRILLINRSRLLPLDQENIREELLPVPEGLIFSDTLREKKIIAIRPGISANIVRGNPRKSPAPTELDDELKRRYVKVIADKLEAGHVGKHYDRLILVAPTKILSEIRKHLKPFVQRSVAAVVAKDLAQHDTRTLMQFLQTTLNTARVA